MVEQLLNNARQAFETSPPVGDPAYARYCQVLSSLLTQEWASVLQANAHDLNEAERRGLPSVLVERLRMGDSQLRHLVALTGKVARELPAATASTQWVNVDDWGTLRRVPKPLGVVFMVYEARPTVTVEGALIPVVVGNAVLLRGGKEMAATDAALADIIQRALLEAGLPASMVTIVSDPDRSVLRELLKRHDAIDVLIPRGSPSLIDHCRSVSSIPVIASGGGVNHIYVHHSADLELAAAIALDSKLAEPTACNTVELMLVDAQVAEAFVEQLIKAGTAAEGPITLRLGAGLQAHDRANVSVQALGEHDLGREFLDATLGVLPVSGLDEAVAHIRRYGSKHTEGIIGNDAAVIDRFVALIDAAAVVINGSLRLHDGPTLELGSEISISTGRLHVRGSVTLTALLTYSWVVDAKGALRADRSTSCPF
ncbi:gamma-glutamyl-phosphate reductase [Pseudomonas syringae group genomosp. 3]|nr:gamma-glutamyl-phosphate reductase [Pseudomonas syringae group genomosp. 3]